MSQLRYSINLDKCPIFTYKDYEWEDCEDYAWKDDDFYLTESDFYPPPDNRVWQSYIEDVEGGDNFADFCDEFFKILDEEEYWEN